jgi:hypothetical protein
VAPDLLDQDDISGERVGNEPDKAILLGYTAPTRGKGLNFQFYSAHPNILGSCRL